jgi:hypothetical protein
MKGCFDFIESLLFVRNLLFFIHFALLSFLFCYGIVVLSSLRWKKAWLCIIWSYNLWIWKIKIAVTCIECELDLRNILLLIRELTIWKFMNELNLFGFFWKCCLAMRQISTQSSNPIQFRGQLAIQLAIQLVIQWCTKKYTHYWK